MKHHRFREAGLSLVEMMVGIAVGLIVVAGASLMMTRQVTENSRLLLETQLQQDLRAAADLMLRDIRRAGYVSNAATTVWQPGGAAVTPNIYAPTSARQVNDNVFLYAYDRAAVAPAGTVPGANESFGFRLRSIATANGNVGVIDALNGASFDPAVAPQAFAYAADAAVVNQPLTDPATVNITAFRVTLVNQPVAAGEYANPPLDAPCALGDANCPCIVVRRVDITITGQAVRDSQVQRTIMLSSRLRNDQLLPPTCAAPASP